jgi:hypothetical protein
MQAANKAAAAAGPLESLRAPVLYIQHAWWPSSCLTAIQYIESSGWHPPPFLRACTHYIGPVLYIMSMVSSR